MTQRFDILLVEDQVRHQRTMVEAIEAALPAKVRCVASGEEALLALKPAADAEPPDLVLLDLDLPGLGGEVVLRQAKADARLRHVPFIILTGSSGFDTQMRLLDAGADDFIEKGDSPEILLARLKAQLRHKVATDRLERMALERDLFAAGVLSDIGNVKWTILSACRQLKERIGRDPEGAAEGAQEHLERLTSVASKLGSYASDVIQSVRDTSRKPTLAPQEFAALFAWVGEVLAADGTGGRIEVDLQAPESLEPVKADKSFLRLALLNIAQFVLSAAPGQTKRLALIATQTARVDAHDPHGRTQVVTRLVAPSLALDDVTLGRIFRPSLSEANLGLSLAAKVMTKMSGEAWVEREGKALQVAFCLALPRI